MAHLSHRNLLSILDLFEWNGLTVLVMPRIDGETLHQKMLRQQPWDSKETALFLVKLADAVQTAILRASFTEISSQPTSSWITKQSRCSWISV